MSGCRVCSYPIEKFFSLGKMPLVNNFLKKSELKSEKKFDLSLGFCPKCYLVQLIETVDPKILFRHYLYFSSVTQSIWQHSKKTAQKFIEQFGLKESSLVLEIGSNDGVHLQFYKKAGIDVLGIDPAKNIAKVANKKGIKTIPEFFNSKLAKKLVQEGIKADLVYGANVFAHVPEIVDLTKGIKLVLKKSGTAVFEFPYVKGLLENKFDTIYHEHVFYYSIIALQSLFSKVGLQTYDVEKIPMQGGSLRIYVSHQGRFTISPRVTNLIKQELLEDYNSVQTYKKMGERVKQLKEDVIMLLVKLKKNKKRIAGYGAPAKGIILLNYFGIKKYIDFIVDKAPAKQGLYTPGTHMLVYAPPYIEERKPDYLFVFPWNIVSEVMNERKIFKKQGGKFIIPIPKLTIV